MEPVVSVELNGDFPFLLHGRLLRFALAKLKSEFSDLG